MPSVKTSTIKDPLKVSNKGPKGPALSILTQRRILCKCLNIKTEYLDLVTLDVEVAGGVVPQVQVTGQDHQDDLHARLQHS